MVKAKRKYTRKVDKRLGPRKQMMAQDTVAVDPVPSNVIPAKRVEAVREERRRRDDMNTDGFRRRLSVNHALLDHEEYRYHWINDTPGRLHALTVLDDWDIMRDPAIKDDGKHIEGAQVRNLVGTAPDNKPLYAYLARKRKKWWQADRAKAQASLDKFDEELQRGITKDPAALKATDPHAYVPEGFDKAVKVSVSGDQPRRMQSYEP